MNQMNDAQKDVDKKDIELAPIAERQKSDDKKSTDETIPEAPNNNVEIGAEVALGQNNPNGKDDTLPPWFDDLLSKLKMQNLKASVAIILVTALANAITTGVVTSYLDSKKAARDYKNNVALVEETVKRTVEFDLKKNKVNDELKVLSELEKAFLDYQRGVYLIRVLSLEISRTSTPERINKFREELSSFAELQFQLSQMIDACSDEKLTTTVTALIDKVSLDDIHEHPENAQKLIPPLNEYEKALKQIRVAKNLVTDQVTKK